MMQTAGRKVGQGFEPREPVWSKTFRAKPPQHVVEQRSNCAVRDSPTSIPTATPSKPPANMLKVVTDLRRSTFVEFLQVILPKIAKLWGSCPFAFSGRAPQPKPWMWRESQAVHVADVFFNDGDALFFDKGDP